MTEEEKDRYKVQSRENRDEYELQKRDFDRAKKLQGSSGTEGVLTGVKKRRQEKEEAKAH